MKNFWPLNRSPISEVTSADDDNSYEQQQHKLLLVGFFKCHYGSYESEYLVIR
jgi:hypothetical protein